MTQVVGLDVGTQGTKGLVLDLDAGHVVARAYRSYDLIGGLAPGAAEQDPRTWAAAVAEVCAELVRAPGVDGSRLAGAGVSGQQHGCVALDENHEPVRAAKLWCDTETAPEAAALSRELGVHVPAGFTASKVRWLRDHEPENWKRTRHVVLPHDYINLLLTGVLATEAGDASGTGYFDVAERRFDLDRAATIDPDLPGKLPTVLAPDATLGRVSAQGSAWSGLPAGLAVAVGGGDNMLSAIGSGATEPGVVTVSLGTSGTVFTHSDAPVVDPSGLIAPFCGSAGGWMPLLCVMNLTGVTGEVQQAFGMDHGALTQAAESVAPGCDGLTWLPYLAGERVPDLPDATGTLLGMRAGALEPGRLYRAALEGTSLNLAWGVDRMRALGLEVRRVHLVGGAARNGLWQRILAASLDAQVVPLEEAESAALGGALQAMGCLRAAAGESGPLAPLARPFVLPAAEAVEPDGGLVEFYASAGREFRAAVESRYGS